MHSACSSPSAWVSRCRFAESATRTISVSRLNSAAPYNTHAWPPIRRYCTRWVVRVERTLRIGFGVKGPSHGQIVFPQLLRLAPAFLWRQLVPLLPFAVTEN